jgi:uncharacterized protein involved in exopolysaccharide biosynthesis
MNNDNSKAPLTPSSTYESPQDSDYRDDEIDLRELFGIIWKGKWWIIAITFVFAVGSVFYSLSLPNIYKSEATLAPSEDSSGGGLSRMAGQLGGLASLAGINLGSSGSNKTVIALEILRSRAFLTEFVDNHKILPELMAVDSWNRDLGVTYNKEIYNPKSDTWTREVEPPQSPKPTSWEYVKVFRDSVLQVKKNEENGLVTLSVSHKSPEIAQQWVSWLVEDINNAMRLRDIQEAQRSVKYLTEELEETSLSDMQQVFYQLIEQQTQTIMLANVRPEYVFQVIDPPVVPEQKDKPSRALVCVVGTMLGGFLSLIVVFVRNFFRKQIK